eukprot:364080-Chlamydomonas_euryale.AAC.6
MEASASSTAQELGCCIAAHDLVLRTACWTRVGGLAAISGLVCPSPNSVNDGVWLSPPPFTPVCMPGGLAARMCALVTNQLP